MKVNALKKQGPLKLCFLVAAMLCFALTGAASADPLVVRGQPSGDTYANAYVITGESRTYFGNVEGGTPPYQFKWEFSDGVGDTAYAAVGDPRYIPFDGKVFSTAGTHFARLTVTDSDPTPATKSATIVLQVIPAASDSLGRQKNSAIDRGLRQMYLLESPGSSGSSWPGSGAPIGSTGMALLAFENHGHNLQSPDMDIYKKSVQEGVRFLLNNAWNVPMSNQTCIGDPEANDGDNDHNGIGIVFSPNGSGGAYWDEMYESPIAMLALVNSCDEAYASSIDHAAGTTSGDVNGRTLRDIIIDAKDFIAYAQRDGGGTGGWFSCSSPDGLSWVNIPTNALDATGLSASRRSSLGWQSWGPGWDGTMGFQFSTYGRELTSFWAQLLNPSVCPGQFTIDWGDGTSDVVAPTSDYCDDPDGLNNYSYTDGIVHTYPSPGTYTVTIWQEGTLIGSVDTTISVDTFACPGQFTINWGDGSAPQLIDSYGWGCPSQAYIDSMVHSYASAGTYSVSVSHEGTDLCTTNLTVSGGSCGNNAWRYQRNYSDNDNSVSQWPVLALSEARNRWHVDINPNVITELDSWVTNSQDAATGGFGYDAAWSWQNFPKTAAGMIMQKYLGRPITDPTVVSAMSYLDANWGSGENLGEFYGLYAFYKAMKLWGITNFMGRDWDNLYTQYLVATQASDNMWTDGFYFWYDRNFATYTAIAILAPEVASLPPIAEAGGPYADVSANQSVILDGSGSHHQDANKHIVKYEWDFDASDGLWWNTKAVPDPAEGGSGISEDISYPDTGSDTTYTVTLRVTDDSSPAMTALDTATVRVKSGEVSPTAVTNGPWAGLPNIPITFDGSASFDANSCTTAGDPKCLGDAIVSYEWDLNGDGIFNGADDGTPVVPGDYSKVQKSFSGPTSLTAVLRVTDRFGATGTSSAQASIVTIALVYGQQYTPCYVDRLDRFRDRMGVSVRFKNQGTGTAENVVMTLKQVPTNLTILSSVVGLGTLAPGAEATSACNAVARTADIVLQLDKRIRPTGQWKWRAEFDFTGHHYVIDNIPALLP